MSSVCANILHFLLGSTSMWTCVKIVLETLLYLVLFSCFWFFSEMTSSCLGVFRMCCSPTVLQTLERLVSKVRFYRMIFFCLKWCIIKFSIHCLSHLLQVQMASGKGGCHLIAFTEDIYEKAEQMFASCNVWLKRHGDTVKMELKQKPGNLPLVLCIAIRGLASLALWAWTKDVFISPRNFKYYTGVW